MLKKFNTHKGTIIFVLLLSLLFSSCGLKEFTDFDEIKVKSSAEMVLPVAYGNITMQSVINMLGDDSLIGKNAGNEMLISFEQKDIFNFAVGELISFESSIDLISNEELIKIDQSINDIVNGFSFVHAIKLGDLLEELSGDIQELKDADGQAKQFPKYTYQPNSPAEFSPGPVDDFETVTFSAGQLIVSLTNHLPVYGIDVEAELWDKKLNKSISTITFGKDKLYPGYELYYTEDWFDGPIGLPGSICIDGGAPGAATDSDTIDLSGVTISNELVVRLKYFRTNYGSGNKTPIIRFADALDFAMEFQATQVSKGKFEVPQRSITGENQKLPNISIADGIDLHKARLSSGTLNIVMKKSLPITGNMNLSFPSIKRNGAVVTSNKNFTAANQNTFAIDLSGTEIDFSENVSNLYNTLYYSYSILINPTTIDYLVSDKIEFDISISDLKVESAEGNFGEMDINLDESEFNLSLDILDQLQGDFKFLDPKIKLVVNNSALEAPTSVALDLTGYSNNGKSAKLSPPAFSVPVPDFPVETFKSEEISFNKDNSNIVEFISLPPTQKITYSGNIKLNPNGKPDPKNMNYVVMNGNIGFDLAVEVPINFQSEGINFTDTIAFDGETLELIRNGEMLIRADNGLPLGVELQLTFIDSLTNTTFGEGIEVMLLTAANVDDTGKVVSPSSSKTSISLTSENIPDYRKANAIIMLAKIASPEKGAKPAKLSSTDNIYLNIGLKAGIEL